MMHKVNPRNQGLSRILMTSSPFPLTDDLMLTADHQTVKLADFGLAREESLMEMMTAETGTYRYMAPELYSTVTLRHGDKSITITKWIPTALQSCCGSSSSINCLLRAC